LRAFEAAARHQSFARAADELHVTQGAVSRHVRLLEDELGTVLFRRHARGIELTAQGRALLPELTASFERIARAARRAADGDRELRVASPPTLAARWLVRRLAGFRDLRPDLRVALGVNCSYDDFFRGGFDLGIADHDMDRDRPPGLEAVLLRREALTPVCAPALLREDRGGLREPSDLERHVLLHPHPAGRTGGSGRGRPGSRGGSPRRAGRCSPRWRWRSPPRRAASAWRWRTCT
jgi:LysR family glycine cleavage system transcriptional activator